MLEYFLSNSLPFLVHMQKFVSRGRFSATTNVVHNYQAPMKPLHEGDQSLPTARIAAQEPKVGALLCWQCFQSINYLILFQSLLAINSRLCLTFNNILIVTVVFFSTPTPITRFDILSQVRRPFNSALEACSSVLLPISQLHCQKNTSTLLVPNCTIHMNRPSVF